MLINRTENFLTKNRNIFMLLLQNLFLLCFLLIFFGQFTSLSIYEFINLKTLISLSIVFAFTWFFLLVKKDGEYYKKKFTLFFKYSFLFLIILISLIGFCNVNKITSLDFNNYILYLELISIGCGYFFLYFNKENINKYIDNNEDKGKNLINLLIIIISTVFIVTRIGLPLINSSSYVDEYYHILSGIEFFKNFHFSQFTTDAGMYTRGSYISFLSGLLMKILGNNIYVAKMIPATIGIINFYILKNIAKNIINNKLHILLLLIIYTISPWIIFNHFYVRFFVFYEFIILASILSFIYILNNKNNIKNWILLIIINLFGLLFSNDLGIFFPLLGVTIFLLYYYFILLKTNIKYLKFINNIYYKVIIFLPFSVFAFFILDIPDKIFKITSGLTLYGASTKMGYYNFFFNINPIITILFIIFILSVYNQKNHILKILSIICGISFFIMINLNLQLQMIRVIVYFLPIYYIGSIMIFYEISILYKKKINIIITLLILITIVLNYPKYFFNQINMPGEITMHYYKEISVYANLKCTNKNIYILNNEPQIFSFYLKHDFKVFYIRNELLEKDHRFQLENNQYRVLPNKEVVVNESKKIKEIIDEGNYCILMNSDYDNNWRYIEQSDFIKIKETSKMEKFNELDLYIK